MIKTVVIEPIQNNFDATEENKIYFKQLYNDERVITRAYLQIFEINNYSDIVLSKTTINSNAWTIAANELQNGKTYVMRAKLWEDTDYSEQGNFWSDFIKFNCEKKGVISLITPSDNLPNNSYLRVEREKLDLKMYCEQINNDIPQKIKYEFFKGFGSDCDYGYTGATDLSPQTKDLSDAETYLESEWLYLNSPFPTLGGRVRIVAIPPIGTHTFIIKRFGKPIVNIPFEVTMNDTRDSIAFNLAHLTSINNTNLRFELEGSLITFRTRESVLSVEFDTSLGFNFIETEPLVFDYPTFSVTTPINNYSRIRVTVLSQKGITTQFTSKFVRFIGEPLFIQGQLNTFFYDQAGVVKVDFDFPRQITYPGPNPDKIRVMRRRIDGMEMDEIVHGVLAKVLKGNDVLLEQLKALDRPLNSSEIENLLAGETDELKRKRCKDYVLYHKNFNKIFKYYTELEHNEGFSALTAETKTTVNTKVDWEYVVDFDIVRMMPHDDTEPTTDMEDIYHGFDRTVANGCYYEYSVEAVKNDGMLVYVAKEHDVEPYIPIKTKKVFVDFEDDFIHDQTGSFRIRLNRKINNITVNRNSQKIETMNSQFPYVISNQLNYKSGSISFDIVSEQSHMLSKINIASEKDFLGRFEAFLSNGSPKLLRTKDGEVLIVAIVGNINIAVNEFIAGLFNISFDFVEIAKPNFENLSKYNLIYKSSNDKNLLKMLGQ